MDTVPVNLGNRSYQIMIEAGLLSRAGSLIAGLPVQRSAVVITDATVAPLYLEIVQHSLAQNNFKVHTVIIAEGEQHKNIATVERIYLELSGLNLDRGSPLVALGGGVVGDIAGFVASTFLRGLPYVQLPTTLLAQVDSSVGGKTGFNLPAAKNLAGSFYQPWLVIIDPCVLTTLDPRELRAGMAEVIKYGIIIDSAFFSTLSAGMDRALALHLPTLSGIIRACCIHKASITSRDETEKGLRSILNFGHTIGHAIETLTNYRTYRHGEAVAMGMAAAARLSHGWGLCNDQTVRPIIDLLKQACLATELPPFAAEEYLGVIQKDKKKVGERLRMVLVRRIGEVVISDRQPAEISAALRSFFDLG